MTTGELDIVGKELLEKYGANSAPKITYDFPGYTCVSALMSKQPTTFQAQE